MAYVEENGTNGTSFSGFQIDLLERLQTFAAEDGVNLQVDLEQGPQDYADAFDLIANDCNTSSYSEDDCQRYDMIIGDYYVSADRYMRADFSPAWLRTTVATMKYIHKEEGIDDFTTLSQAEAAKATVCVPQGSYLARVVQDKFPNNLYRHCDPAAEECIDWLKNGKCALFAEDELVLHHMASNDVSLEVTGESFNTQYVVWPFREDLARPVSKLMKKWMYRAVESATLDELYFQYFKQALCPIGTAGENCELPCDPDHGAPDKMGVCICKSSKWTGYDCSIEVPEELNMLSPQLIITAYVLAGLNFLLVTICGIWLFMNRKRAHVRMAQPMFLMLILIGCVISTSTIFAMAQEDEGHGPVHACAALPWLYSVGFCLTFGALFAKINRISAVLKSAVNMQRVAVSASETLVTVALVLAIDIVFLTAWTVVDPLTWTRTTRTTDVFGVVLESDGFCESEYQNLFGGLIFFFHFLLMAMACFKCYQARKIPERISNGKYVAIAMFGNLQIFCIVIPVLILLGTDHAGASFFIMSGAIWMNDFMVLCSIFGHLMYKVYNHDAQSLGNSSVSRHSSHRQLSEEIRKYAQAVRGLTRGLSMGVGLAIRRMDCSSGRDSDDRWSSDRQRDPEEGERVPHPRRNATKQRHDKATEVDTTLTVATKKPKHAEDIEDSATLEMWPGDDLDETDATACVDSSASSRMPALDESEFTDIEDKPVVNQCFKAKPPVPSPDASVYADCEEIPPLKPFPTRTLTRDDSVYLDCQDPPQSSFCGGEEPVPPTGEQYQSPLREEDPGPPTREQRRSSPASVSLFRSTLSEERVPPTGEHRRSSLPSVSFQFPLVGEEPVPPTGEQRRYSLASVSLFRGWGPKLEFGESAHFEGIMKSFDDDANRPEVPGCHPAVVKNSSQHPSPEVGLQPHQGEDQQVEAVLMQREQSMRFE